MTRRTLLAAAAFVAVVGLVLVANTLRLGPSQRAATPLAPLTVDAAAAAARLAGALRVRTVAGADAAAASSAFDALHERLRGDFPRVHAALTREVVGGASLLYTWRGTNESLPPILLLAHQDVVPADEGGWTYPPFSGTVEAGAVWGRGALDDKAALMAMLEAVERMLAEGIAPERTVYLAFGHDEETGGLEGARRIAGMLAARGESLELVLDEGLVIVHDVLPVPAPVALVGVAEKGVMNIELVASAAAGHASMPGRDTAIGGLASALQRIAAEPPPASLDGVAAGLFASLAPEMSFPARLVFANLWLFRPLVERQLTRTASTNALVRTTMVPTVISGGVRDNVLPARAAATLHVRLRPGDSAASALAFVRDRVADERIEVRPLGEPTEPAPASPSDSAGFELVAGAIRDVFPDVVVAPGLVLAATDARHFTSLTRQVYRFAPLRLRGDETTRIHGVDERISVTSYVDAIRFYHRLLQTAAGATTRAERSSTARRGWDDGLN
jgi:carboxypeptidase PM20D1